MPESTFQKWKRLILSGFKSRSVLTPIGVNNASGTPVYFFYNDNDGFDKNQIQSFVSKHGTNILIGMDPGDTDVPSDDAMDLIQKIRDFGLKLHVYNCGPGDMAWSGQEANQVRYLAKSVGIDLNNPHWHNSWQDWGWELKAFQQFEYYFKKYNAYSMELDNLSNSVLEDDGDKIAMFYTRFSKKLADAGIKTKLMIKNLSEDNLMIVKNYISAGTIPKDFLAPWGMFEKDSGDQDEQIRICKSMGIYAVTPKTGMMETHEYGVKADGVPCLKI